MRRPRADTSICRVLRRSGYLLIAVGVATLAWAVLLGDKTNPPLWLLILGLLPLFIMFWTLRLAHGTCLCVLTAVTTGILVVSAAYLYFDAFLVSLSGLNTVLLIEVPLSQLLVAGLPFVAVVWASRRLEK